MGYALVLSRKTCEGVTVPSTGRQVSKSGVTSKVLSHGRGGHVGEATVGVVETWVSQGGS